MPRLAGESKHGLRDRAWSGLVDCIAVRWLISRGLDLSDDVRS